MKILAFSPIELPWTEGARYSGLERLAVQHASEWAKLGHNVTLLAHTDTSWPDDVKQLPSEGYINGDRRIHAEQKAFQKYQSIFRDFDVIWDIGHLHLIARYMPNMPVVSVFSANPEYEARTKSQKAPYNLISWSKWGIGQIQRYYQRASVYQETIMVDPDVFKPGAKRTERFLSLGRMGPQKGNLNAAVMCQKLGLQLDIVAARGSEVAPGQPLTKYEEEVTKICDGEDIVWYGEVNDEQRVEIMQRCKALLYLTNHTEITSHKTQEAMLCGAPAIVPNLGGMPEIVTHGVDGFLCNSSAEFMLAVDRLHTLDPAKTRHQLAEKHRPENVAKGYIDLLEKVADGLRW